MLEVLLHVSDALTLITRMELDSVYPLSKFIGVLAEPCTIQVVMLYVILIVLLSFEVEQTSNVDVYNLTQLEEPFIDVLYVLATDVSNTQQDDAFKVRTRMLN